MNELPEHVRISIPRVLEIDAAVEALITQMDELRGERQELINGEARKVAKYSVGQEFIAKRNNRRFRIVSVSGEYTQWDHLDTPIIWVRYNATRILKDGSISTERATLYPDSLNMELVKEPLVTT